MCIVRFLQIAEAYLGLKLMKEFMYGQSLLPYGLFGQGKHHHRPFFMLPFQGGVSDIFIFWKLSDLTSKQAASTYFYMKGT